MRITLLTLGLVFALGAASASDAGKIYKEGRRAERAGEFARAYLLYSQAAAMEPDNQLYWVRSQALRPLATSEIQKNKSATANSSAVSPQARYHSSLTAKDLAEARKPLSPPELTGTPGRINLDFRGDSKILFERAARAFGLDCVFDGDYQPIRAFRFQLRQATYRDALYALQEATDSFIVPLSSRLFLVVRDTPQKRKDVEPTVAIAIPLPEPTNAKDLTQLIAAVQQSLALPKAGWDTQNNTVVIRGPVSKVIPARKIFEELLHPRAQVAIEMKVVELNRKDALTYGIGLPTSFPIIPLTTVMNHVPVIPSGITHLALFGGGASLFGIGLADAQLFATLTKSNARTLMDMEIRSIDGQPAQIHVGDRYPVLTSGYFGPANFQQGGQVYTPPPSFTFEDLGLSLKVTPKVHGTSDVTLDLESEFRVLSGQGVNGIPIISNRQLKSTVRLKLGNWAVISGIMNDSEARSISGIAGLSSIPGLGALLRQNNKNDQTNEILIVLKPTLLSLPPDQTINPVVWLGSEQRPVTPL